jgi:hypothetical protein
LPPRLEVHSATIEFEAEDDEMISVGGFVVFDNVAAIVRYASISMNMCERWIETWGHKYPDPEDDDLS